MTEEKCNAVDGEIVRPAISRTVGQVTEEVTITKKDGNDLLIRIKHAPPSVEYNALRDRIASLNVECDVLLQARNKALEELAVAQETIRRMHATYNALAASIKKLAEIA